jgi:hypothetical protein
MVDVPREQGTAMVLFSTQRGPAHNRSGHVARISKDDHAFYAVVETGSTCHLSANTVIMATSLHLYFSCYMLFFWGRGGVQFLTQQNTYSTLGIPAPRFPSTYRIHR